MYMYISQYSALYNVHLKKKQHYFDLPLGSRGRGQDGSQPNPLSLCLSSQTSVTLSTLCLHRPLTDRLLPHCLSLTEEKESDFKGIAVYL